jgi:hypothetical protein
LLETTETEGGKFGMKQFFLELWKFLNQRKWEIESKAVVPLTSSTRKFKRDDSILESH